jgi:hypothetical protein
MSEKRTIHVQTITLTIVAIDDDIDALDAANERIKKFIQSDLPTENDIMSGPYDGLILVADGKHEDVVGTMEEFEAWAAEDDEGTVNDGEGLVIPMPQTGKEWLN